ncbi:Uncharacterised protein [Mycobacteroides abscessus]|nr:Uncharacterised protein [Mycobacteroides abscessus]SLD14786.1 Uncharacterised protein [Mycobacteroides abscessus subsp. massiliense]
MHTKVIAPLLSRAIRQLLTSSTEEATSRPASPPTVVPAMYLPIAEPSDPGCTSSAKNAIATAGIPARAAPSAARPINNTANVGLAGRSSPMIVVTIAETSMTRVRPNRSESALAGMIDRASIPVVTETVRAAEAGLTPRSAESAGSTAWVP